jgi:hypothetical protein
MPAFTKLFAPSVSALAEAAADALANDPGIRRGALCPSTKLEDALRAALSKQSLNLLDARNLDLYERRDIGGVIGHLRIVSNSRFDGLLDRAQSLFPLLDHNLLRDLREVTDDASAVYESFMDRSGYLSAAEAAKQEGLVDALTRLGAYVREFARRSEDKSLSAFMNDWEAYRLTDGGAGEGIRLHTPASLKGMSLEAIAVLLPEGQAGDWRAWTQAAHDHASERVYLATVGTPVPEAETA